MSQQNTEDHDEQYCQWLYDMGDTIKIISIETKVHFKPKGFYCQKFSRRYKYKFSTTIIYAKIGDAATGRL